MGNLKVIGGEKRGFRISTAGARELRPTAARVREAVFNVLRDRIRDARFLDLFAGTGAIGIEALSRGASTCVLVESRRQAIDLIRKNLEACGFTSRARVLRGILPACLPRIASFRPFDLIYVDPPYSGPTGERVLGALGEGLLLDASSWVIYEHPKSRSPLDHHGRLRLARSFRHGDTVLSVYHSDDPAARGEPPAFDRFPT